MSREELKNPRRRTLTKRLVREALLEMLKDKGIQDISVSELCAAAGINRTTFYNHYAGTYEVLAEIEGEFLVQLCAADAMPGGEGGLEEHIESLCRRLQQDRQTALLLLANNIDPQFSAKLLETQGCGGVWQRACAAYPPAESELLGRFVRGGAYAMVCSWLERGCQESPGQVAHLLASVIEGGVRL